MNEKPILFSGEMVRAILAGRKTQTRRVMKPQPVKDEYDFWTWAGAGWSRDDIGATVMPGHSLANRCPYVCDHLWVRETWRIVGWDEDGDWCVEYKDGTKIWFDSVQEIDEDTSVRYWEQCTDDCLKAGIAEDEGGYFTFNENECPTRWRPSIFMPRWASRINLEIVNIRVERLSSISRNDIDAEGTPPIPDQMMYRNDGYQRFKDFKYLWGSINAKRDYSWDTNPWVWVIEFKRVKP